MKSQTHEKHISTRHSHNDCRECRADTERRFVGTTPHPFRNNFVSKYLSWVRPRMAAIKAGDNSVEARIWHRDFIKAMNRRISSHLHRAGRKFCDSYIERLRQFRGMKVDAGYLREFARCGASALR